MRGPLPGVFCCELGSPEDVEYVLIIVAMRPVALSMGTSAKELPENDVKLLLSPLLREAELPLYPRGTCWLNGLPVDMRLPAATVESLLLPSPRSALLTNGVEAGDWAPELSMVREPLRLV